jgi:outer membrane cobalamin receptor
MSNSSRIVVGTAMTYSVSSPTGGSFAAPTQGAYSLWNSRVGYYITPTLDLSGTIENVFDNAYMGCSEYVPGGVPHRGRTVFVELRYESL